MAYIKQEWIDRIIAEDTGEVLQNGTLVSAARLNHMEDGIAGAYEAVDQITNGSEGVTLSSLSTSVIDLQTKVEGFEGKGVNCVEKNETMTLKVGIDSDGQLWAESPPDGDEAVY